MDETIGIIGLGYVGLPVALAFAASGRRTIGFDIDERRIVELSDGHDRTGEKTRAELLESKLELSADPAVLEAVSVFVVTVPTPIDGSRQPDLTALLSATKTVGRVLKPGAIVVYESTVYPGLTEETCGPALASASGLQQGVDFKLGYSPERINPGDKEHTLERVIKVVAAEDAESLDRVAALYESIVEAGVHRASSIKVAEAAKVIENTQRDLNIALMNELAIIFDRLDISTKDVLAAAGTKWNFLPFTPGLVGGHCIGVDPYYLTARAESVGYHPEVILAGRRINDGMGAFVAGRLIKLLVAAGRSIVGSRVAVLGLTFKQDVPDLRNSRVPDILTELAEFGISASTHDPLADPDEARRLYGVELAPLDELGELDAIVLAVPHAAYLEDAAGILQRLAPSGVVVDVKSALRRESLPESAHYWSL